MGATVFYGMLGVTLFGLFLPVSQVRQQSFEARSKQRAPVRAAIE